MFSEKIPTLILMTLAFLFAVAAKADPVGLDFKTWKEQQILSAQNRLLRASAELDVLKNSGAAKEASDDKASKKQKALTRFQKSQEKSGLERLENAVQLAKEAVQNANDLNLDDYVTIYLPSLSQNPESLETLMESLSKEEISKILTEILKKQSDQRDKASLSPSKLSGFWSSQASNSK